MSREIQDLMQKLIDYALVEHHQEYDELYGKSLVLSLLYEKCMGSLHRSTEKRILDKNNTTFWMFSLKSGNFFGSDQ